MLRAPAFTACLARVFVTLLLVTPARAAEPLASLLPGEAMVERMLRAAKLGPADYLIDLGTGDGRIVLAATRRFGARAHGIDADATVVALNTQRAQSMGLAGRASFAKGDALEADLAKASVVVVSSPVASTAGAPASQLGPRLFALKPGSRVLALQAGLGEWAPDEVLSVDGRTAYLWVVPALANGMWQLRLGGPGSRRDDRLRITQRYQAVAGELLAGGSFDNCGMPAARVASCMRRAVRGSVIEEPVAGHRKLPARIGEGDIFKRHLTFRAGDINCICLFRYGCARIQHGKHLGQ